MGGVIPSKAGISASRTVTSRPEIPAYAGMTGNGRKTGK